jgi:archaeosine synthase alpha-subunit
VLEVTAFDGRARVAQWSPAPGQAVRTPGMLWPDVTIAQRPAWVEAIVTARPTGQGVELVSGGTWFHPTGLGGPLAIQPPRPAPTTEVQVLKAGEELAVLHDASGWASNPKNLVPALIRARVEATDGRLLWAPGLGTPQDYALWAYLGVDLFDASPLLLAAVRGTALTPDGELSAKQAEAVFGGAFDEARLVAHNLEAARTELAGIRLAIQEGRLRSLVERRIYSKAASVEVLRRFDREHGYLEAASPRHRDAPLPAMTAEALWMPEVEAFRRRVAGAYEPPPAPILLLLPCSRGKPYKTSRSHRILARALDETGMRSLVHEVMVTSPLGLVPRELEECYPAQAYDIPVTGNWLADEEEVVRGQLAALLDKHPYRHAVAHLGQATFDALRDLLPPDTTRHTSLHHPTSHDDLERLKAELLRLKGELGATVDAREAGRRRKLDDLRALLSFQFGAEVAADLTAGAEATGRMPYVRLERAGVQLGTTTPGRGVVSLTMEGAKALAAHRTKRVFIGDFTPKGTSSLFAVGVAGADPDVRAGDEVVVVRGDEPIGNGVAQMHASAMAHLRRGVAVTLRHLGKQAPAPTPAPLPSALQGGGA